MTSHAFDAAHGERSVFDHNNLVTSELGLHASQWRCQFGSKNEGGDGEAERFFSPIMKARRVSRTGISLRMCAAL